MIKAIILFAIADSINPDEITFTSEKNKNKPKARKKQLQKNILQLKALHFQAQTLWVGLYPYQCSAPDYTYCFETQ